MDGVCCNCSEAHPQNVFVAMRNILALVIKESEEVSQALLEAVLSNILKDKKVHFFGLGRNLDFL